MKDSLEPYILPHTKKWLAFFAISLVTTMINLDITIVNLAVAAAVVSPFVGLWLDRAGFVFPTAVSLFLSLIGFLLLTQLNTALSAPLLISAFVLLGIGAPIINSSTPALSLSTLPEKDRGAGMGAFYMFAFIGSLAGVALASSLLVFLSDQYFHHLVVAQHLSIQHLSVGELARVLHGASSIQSIMGQGELAAAIKNSFVYGLKAVMWVNAGLVLIALSLCHWLAADSGSKK